MPVSPEYKEFIVEQLERLGPVKMRGMFGGAGVYLDDLMFGVIFDETLYFKVDDRNRADYEAEGKGPFTFEMTDGTTGHLRYYEVPERLYDEPDELVQWARKALDVMMSVRAEKLARAAKAAERKKNAAKKAGAKGKSAGKKSRSSGVTRKAAPKKAGTKRS
ncbi:MAG: TfoX/Sxy family protein [Parvibaculum sp.]|uniref:TfoX/Sxy family protein n=1 Tax=Parvibaculum sp. TaxID=2024848 RepID=UPI00284901E6|nr:TfoX/Sxy family protein [Parvibaculum sp.]MDR3498062.1 TfoX/Sxy family protein [Parvibaculum sp.]